MHTIQTGVSRRTVLQGLALAVPLSGRAVEPAALSLGLIAPTSEEQTITGWQPLADRLGQELKMPVKIVASKNYAQISDALMEGRVQVAWLNNVLAINAVEKDESQIFAQMVRLDGHSGYKSVLLAREDGPVRSIEDVLSKPGAYSLGLADKKSTSGFLVPSYYIFSKNKIDPDKHFSHVAHGSHRDNFLAVAERKVDLAINNTEDMALFRVEFPEKFAMLRVVWESPLIPGDPLLMRKDLPIATKEKIRKFILAYGRNEAEKSTLKAIKMLSGFKASSNYQLRPVADLVLFENLSKAMGAQKSDPDKFAATMDGLQKRAARLDAVLNASRLGTP